MKVNLKEIVENLIEYFLEAGDLSIQLREKGLIKKIKPMTVDGKILHHQIVKYTPFS